MYNRNTLLTERPIGNVNIVKHTIRVVAVLLTAEKETSVKFIGQKSRQTGQQMKRDMKNTGKAASYLAGSVVPQKKKRAVPNFVKRPQSIQPPSRSQPGRSISIGVNYIARKPAPGKTAAGMVPRTRNRIAISNINYISGKPDRRNKIPPAEIRPSNAIAIGNINYIARKTMQRGGSSRVQAPSSNRIDINNINYIARKRQ
ncbi:MAG TPA: hypothetical protein ENI97_15495 [Gammaproteobacteria bacterium]|nr:hypothetical protein [Gammaproteobacteria bacterium]